MNYYLKENASMKPMSVKSYFSSCSEKKDMYVFGEYSNGETEILQNLNLCFFGKFPLTSVNISKEDKNKKIKDLFKEIKIDKKDFLKNEKYKKNDVLFEFNESKSLFFSKIKIKFTEKNRRVHLVGDLFEFNYHYIESEKIKNLMKQCTDKRFPTIKNETHLSYMCLKSIFKEEKNIIEYMTSLESKYKEIISKNKGSSNDELQKKINSSFFEIANNFIEENISYIKENNPEIDIFCKRDRDLAIENIKRFFCIGCLLDCKETKNYVLNVIDEDDSMKIFIANNDFVGSLVEEYNKLGGDKEYKNIETFFLNYDFLIKKNKNEKIEFSVVPTKYKNLEGSIAIMNPRYLVSSMAIDWMAYINKLNDKIINYFEFSQDYCPVSIWTVSEDESSIRNLDSSFFYKKIEYKKEEKESEDFFNFLEL